MVGGGSTGAKQGLRAAIKLEGHLVVFSVEHSFFSLCQNGKQRRENDGER